MTDAAVKLPGKPEKALAALLNNPTVRDAAKEAKLSEATLYRYMREPAFAGQLKEARRGAVITAARGEVYKRALIEEHGRRMT